MPIKLLFLLILVQWVHVWSWAGQVRDVGGDGCKGQICQDSGSCCPCPDWVCCQHFSPTTPTCMQAESECPIPTSYNTASRTAAAPSTAGRDLALTTCCPGRVYFLDTWLGTHTSTMSREVTYIHRERVDFVSGEEMVSFFEGLFLSKKGILAFWEPLKKTSQKVKRTFFRENELLK